MRYNVTIQYLFAPDKRKPNERIEMVKIYVLGKFDSTNDVKRRRQALGKRMQKTGKHWIRPITRPFVSRNDCLNSSGAVVCFYRGYVEVVLFYTYLLFVYN